MQMHECKSDSKPSNHVGRGLPSVILKSGFIPVIIGPNSDVHVNTDVHKLEEILTFGGKTPKK